MKRTLVIIFIVILLLAGSLIWLRYGVNHDHIQAFLSNALGSEYSVELQSVRISPLKRAVYLTGLTISATADDNLIFEADTINVSGVGLRSFLGKNLSMAAAHMKNFTLVQSDSLIENDKEEPKVGASIQRINIRNLNLVNGAVKVQINESENYLLNELFVQASIDIKIVSGDRNYKVGYNRLNVDSLGVLISDERYRFSLAGKNFTKKSERLTLSSLKLIPVGGYDQFNRASPYRVDMVDLEIRDFTAYGIVSAAFEHDSIIKADSLVFGYFDIHVAKNKQLPKKPNQEYAKLLNEIVQNLGYGIKLELISFRNAHIRYSEQDEDGVRPGTISFMNSTIHIREVNSRSPSPVVLTAVTYLQNHSELITELRFTLDDETFRMTGAGELQHFDLTRLNSIFKDLEGIKIESGNVHELNFDFEMIGDISTGRMHLLYDDLKIKFVDKDDYSENLRMSVRGFITEKFVLANENLPDDNGTMRTGRIDHKREPNDAFFKYLWQTLRSGILDILIL
jgi:hypothetical protein